MEIDEEDPTHKQGPRESRQSTKSAFVAYQDVALGKGIPSGLASMHLRLPGPTCGPSCERLIDQSLSWLVSASSRLRRERGLHVGAMTPNTTQDAVVAI
jgi:hypothetical protein